MSQSPAACERLPSETAQWRRVELWPGAVFCVRGGAGRGPVVEVRNTDPRTGRWEPEAERWLAEGSPQAHTEILRVTSGVTRAEVSFKPCVDIDDADSLPHRLSFCGDVAQPQGYRRRRNASLPSYKYSLGARPCGRCVLMGAQNNQSIGTEILIVAGLSAGIFFRGYAQALRMSNGLRRSRIIGGSLLHSAELLGTTLFFFGYPRDFTSPR